MAINLAAADFELLRAGDPVIFSKVFEWYKNKMFAIASFYLRNLHDAEDIVAEAFAKFWKNRQELQQTKDIEKFLYTNTIRLSIDLLRRSKRKPPPIFYRNGLDEIPTTTDEDAQLLDRIDGSVQEFLLNTIASEMKGLSPRCKEALHLYHIEHQTLREIADKMEIKINTVREHVDRAEKKIGEALTIKGLYATLKDIWQRKKNI